MAFEKYQAIGSHPSSHTESRKLKAEKEESKKHQCSMCSYDFKMGQVLGIHMRRHREELSRRRAQAHELQDCSEVVHEQELIKPETQAQDLVDHENCSQVVSQ
ncbi:hypothetical protein AMTR_s00018p00216910 [Amborella trichopoda]|uniref:C2H2-type domain-containing protein n=1 Tax=Amborella trichopoda TaxID=13333 RepID=W1PKQ5_AMBTC|nr:hypothetical protein AMTR_s00018p00216910 [Amborella trichopoda]